MKFLQKSEEIFRLLVSSVVDYAIFMIDINGNVVSWNEGAQRIQGYLPEEIIDQHFSCLYPESDISSGTPSLDLDVAAKSSRHEKEGWLIRKDGTKFWAHISITAVNDDAGNLRGFAHIIRDLTERRKFEQRLAAQLAIADILDKSSSLIEATPRLIEIVCETMQWDLGALWTVDEDADLLRCVDIWHNDSHHIPKFINACREFTFASGSGLPGRVWQTKEPAWIESLTTDANFPRASIAAEEQIHAGVAFPILLHEQVLAVIEFFSEEIRKPDQYLLAFFSSLGSQIGQFTERKRAEEALRLNQELTESIINSAYDAFVSIETDSTIIVWNLQAETIFGWSKSEAIGRKLTETIIPARFSQAHSRGLENFLKTGVGPVLNQRIEIAAQHKNGNEFPIELAVFPVQAGNKLIFCAFIHDITKRIKANEDLKSYASRMAEQSQLLDLANDAITVRSLDGKIQYWNRGATALYGWPNEVALGKSLFELLKTKLPITVEALQNVILNEDRWDGELIHTAHDGKMSIVESRQVLQHDNEGRPLRILQIDRDVTQNKQTEERIKQLNLELSHKVTALAALNNELALLTDDMEIARDQALDASRLKSEFVANMSHEIRTPLNGILGMANVLLKTPLDDKQHSYASSIKEAGSALLAVINDILDFSKIEAGKLHLEITDFDLVRLIESTCDSLVIEAREKHLSFVAYIDPSMPQSVRGEPERLRQILINLISNAIKFSDHGEIALYVTIGSDQDNSMNVHFSVQDQGIGLTEEERSRLFEPFVQADGSISRKYGGTGLGLSICKRLVDLMEGTIGVESVKGEGSNFWFVVPMEKRSQLHHVIPQDALANVRVLVADQNPHSREIVRNYMIAWGMRNDTAGNAQEAIDLMRQAQCAGDPYKVVITAMDWSDESAFDLAFQVLEDANLADTKLILLSSFETPGLVLKAIELGFKACLTKPFTQLQLCALMTEVIGAESAATLSRQAVDAWSYEKASMEEKTPQPGVILVVEDQPINQQVAQLYLKDLGFSSQIARNGHEAIELISNNEFILVFMDCQMPDLDGLSATRKIRELEALTGRHTIIIAMTAYAMAGDRERCIAAGMDDYLSKPIDPDQIQKILEKWLPAGSEAERAARAATSEAAGIKVSLPETASTVDLEHVRFRFGVNAPQLVGAFIINTKQLVEDIKQAQLSSEEKRLREAAHSLKGVCGLVGALPLKHLCVEIENAVRSGNHVAVPILVAEIEDEWQRVASLLKANF